MPRENQQQPSLSIGRKPPHRLYRILGDGQDSSWTPIGAAWPNKDGKGFNLTCDAISLGAHASAQGPLCPLTHVPWKPRGWVKAEPSGERLDRETGRLPLAALPTTGCPYVDADLFRTRTSRESGGAT